MPVSRTSVRPFPGAARLIIAAFVPLLASASYQRGMWVRGMSIAHPDSLTRIMAMAEELAITDLYAQVVVGGYAYYAGSAYAPRSEYLARTLPEGCAGYDPLQALVRAAQPKGIRVHAWVNALLVWSMSAPPESTRHLHHQHPDWFLRDYEGRSVLNYSCAEQEDYGLEGTYLDPALEGVRDWCAGLCAEVARRYPVAGVHLDFLRYPGLLWGGAPDGEAHLLAGAAVNDLRWLTLARYPRLPLFRRWLVWRLLRIAAWRSRVVADLVREVSSRVKRERPDCLVSVAATANPARAAYQYGQEWWAWQDMIDYPVVMAYTDDVGLFADLVDFARRYWPEAVMGIGVLWPDMEPEAWWEEEYTRNARMGGVCYFDFASLDTLPVRCLLKDASAVPVESLKRDTTRYAPLQGAFADRPPAPMISQGGSLSVVPGEIDLAGKLLDLSLDPGRDLERLGQDEPDFRRLAAEDLAAFRFLDGMAVLPDVLSELPRRDVAYAHVPWIRGDTSGTRRAAARVDSLMSRIRLHPAAVHVLAQPGFAAELGERETHETRSGIWVYEVVAETLGRGHVVERGEIDPAVLRSCEYWTIQETIAKLLTKEE